MLQAQIHQGNNSDISGAMAMAVAIAARCFKLTTSTRTVPLALWRPTDCKMAFLPTTVSGVGNC